ncbi:hypothetical protein MNBD_CPR01-519, partial [hydrothermal vent metagenome]
HRYFIRPELIYPYATRFGLNVINSFIVIYIPIFLVEKGVSPAYIGGAISVMALIHVLFDFKIGKVIRKRAFKPFFVLGFMLMTIILVGASFIGNAYLLLAIIPFAGVATLFVEPIQDTFFFSLVRKAEDEERLYPIYSTSNQAGRFVAKVLPATVLLFASEKFAYLSVALVLLAVAFMVIFMKEKDIFSVAECR